MKTTSKPAYPARPPVAHPDMPRRFVTALRKVRAQFIKRPSSFYGWGAQVRPYRQGAQKSGCIVAWAREFDPSIDHNIHPTYDRMCCESVEKTAKWAIKRIDQALSTAT